MDTIIDISALLALGTALAVGATGLMHWLDNRMPVRANAQRDRMREMMLQRRKGGK